MNNITSIIRMIAIFGSVELVNGNGFVVHACSVAHPSLGVYDRAGKFYSFVTLRVEGFTVIK